MEGHPVTLVKDGKLLESKFRNEKLTVYNLYRAIRLKGLRNIDEVELAFLETDGDISIIPRSNRNWKILSIDNS